jgi:putative oxygen-independent coproporphyrinogen III oxidase
MPTRPVLTPINADLRSAPGPVFLALPPLAVYIHIPWCVRKCPYCDFNSHEIRAQPAPAAAGRAGNALDAEQERVYVAALVGDLEGALPDVWGRRVTSVFFGGGTPSLLSARAVDDILSALRARLVVEPDAEVTLEANPGTAEAQKFAGFRAAGVNRLSIGIQSFNPGHLKALGRIHDDREARQAIELAQRHFDNFNLDLMYALPGQSADQALADLQQAIDAGAPHVSAYHLTLEPNTYFARFPPPLPDDDSAAQMQEAIEARLESAGYRHYETSAFARPGLESRHNLNYWTFGDYLGIGAGAHSKLSFPDRIDRVVRHKHPRAYLEQSAAAAPVQARDAVAVADLPFEFMMNALRLTGGVPLALFGERTGLPLTAVLPALAQAEARGLIERDHLHLRPTPQGQRFLNDLLQLFLPR